MKALVMWIDSHEAKIFKFNPEGVVPTHLKAHGHHVAESFGRNHSKAEGDAEKFYHEVAKHLEKEKDTQWLVIGPGLGHTHFKHHIEKHHPALAKCIVASEAADKMTDGQIQDYAHRFFTKKGVFTSI